MRVSRRYSEILCIFRAAVFYSYILYSANYVRFCVLQCKDVAVRLQRHNNKGVGSSKAYVPWQLVYFEEYSSRAEASNRELEIKKKAESILNF
jgi:putative endonuclease